ncbi:MAG: hypothetical protein AAB706_00755 [Patescibacteria group bacterium]
MKKQIPKFSKEEKLRLTRPPRLEGKAKNAAMYPIRKKKKLRVVKTTERKEEIINHV